MAITFFGSACNPADNGALDNSVSRSVTPPASMVTGDFVRVVVQVRSFTTTVSNTVTGGQTWTAETQIGVGSSGNVRCFWCRYNGTWAANPEFDSSTHAGTAITIEMSVFRPTTGANTWALDVIQESANFNAPGTPFDVTALGQTSVAANTVTIVTFAVNDINTWALQTGGWSNPSSVTQRRNSTGSDTSLSTAYKIQTSAAATGAVVNRQVTLGGDSGKYIIQTFKEVGAVSSPTITNVDSDNDITATQTGVVIAGTNFEASQGAGTVILWDGVVDASINSTCTVTAWGASSITFTVVQGNVLYGTGKSIEVTTNGGLSVAKGVTLSVPSGTSKTVVTTLKALAWDARGTPSRLTPKGTSGDATADCTGAVQFDYIGTGGSGALTVDVDGRVSWATARTQMTWRWHNGAIWSSVITWDLRGLFPVFSGPNEPNRTFTQNVAISTIAHVTQFSFAEALTPVVYSLQGGAITGLAYSSSTAAETGTPTTVATNTGRSIRATNSEGSYVETNAFSRTIQAAPNPPDFTGTIADQIDDVNTTFSLDVSPFFTFATSWASTGDPLPPGITLNTGTGVISGTSTTVGIYDGIIITGSGTGTPADSNAFIIEIAAVGTIPVPNLYLRTQAQANSDLIAVGLVSGIVSTGTDTAHVGLVIAQSIDAGYLVVPGAAVGYTVADVATVEAFYWRPSS